MLVNPCYLPPPPPFPQLQGEEGGRERGIVPKSKSQVKFKKLVILPSGKTTPAVIDIAEIGVDAAAWVLTIWIMSVRRTTAKTFFETWANREGLK
jgi:hypothetical protein